MIESELTEQIIGGAIEVHRHWGPGLYEEIYEKSLYHELRLRNVMFESQVKLPLIYKGERVGEDLRLDLIVDGKVVVELKSVRTLEPIHGGATVDLHETDGLQGWAADQLQRSGAEEGN